WTFAFALTGLTGLLADLGATTYLTREVARDPSSANRLTVNLVAMRIPLSFGLALVTVLFIHLTDNDDMTRQLVDVLSLGIIVSAVSSVVSGTLQGLQRMRVIATISVLTKIGYSVLAVVFVVMGGGALAVSIAWVVVSAVALVYRGS